MDIGKPQRIIEVIPLEEPLIVEPEPNEPERVPVEPEPEKVPV